MSWMPRPFRNKARKYSFAQFKFPDLNLEEGLESYARFLFARLAFLRGTPCALLKNKKYIPKGDLTLLHVRQHAEREGVLGISLAQKSTGLTKVACASFDQRYVIDAVGLGCRFASTLAQDGIQGLVELCPDQRVRVWALFSEPIPTTDAIARMREIKQRTFISAEAAFAPDPEGGETFIELPPYPDPDTGRWSLVLTLSEAERILDGFLYTKPVPEWDDLLGDLQVEKPTVYVPEPVTAAGEEINSPAETQAAGSSGVLLFLHGQPAESASEENETQEHLAEETAGEGSEHTTCVETSGEIAQASPDSPGVAEGRPELEAAEASQAAESAPRAYSLSPLSGSVPGIIGRLLNPTRQTIPTPSREMNEMLNGGWTLQRVYLIGGGSGEGKTTFCAWASDFAASQNIPAVFVSFQARKELLSVYALARTAKIDSAKIERGLCGEGRSQQSEELRKTLMRAGREYFRTGDYLHVLEADCNTTVSDVQDAVTATRKHFGLEETDPVLVVVDSLREILPDGASEESRKPGRQRIARALLQLKELAQSRNAAVVVTLDTPSAAHTRFGVLSADTQEFETTAGVADTCFVLESHTSRVRSDSEESGLRKRPHTRLQDPLDRLLEDLAHHPVLSRKVQDIRREYVLDEESAATYCRLVPLKNRGGKTNVQPLFVYRRAYHDFEPIPTDLSQAGE